MLRFVILSHVGSHVWHHVPVNNVVWMDTKYAYICFRARGGRLLGHILERVAVPHGCVGAKTFERTPAAGHMLKFMTGDQREQTSVFRNVTSAVPNKTCHIVYNVAELIIWQWFKLNCPHVRYAARTRYNRFPRPHVHLYNLWSTCGTNWSSPPVPLPQNCAQPCLMQNKDI